ncbi:unnamed protein product [Mytilus coruscus]|uniref:Uncharacterized protein n=1 Tax=Mytilus coruscus TaxID=42192 RepID=A0A6J8EJD2_MYTCO|nr:unnamed protein product [Mytilus coruscus]
MMIDTLETENKKAILQGQHVIDVILQREHAAYVRYKPLYPKREYNFPQTRDKKDFVATYNVIPVEECDLELQQGEELKIKDDIRDGWWLAQNKAGMQGYIPSNYIKKKTDLEIFNWFCKSCSRERSELLLRNEGTEGCFLVRESILTGMFALSVLTTESETKVKHYLIKENTEGLFYIDEQDAFPSVQELIQHYKHDSGGLTTVLRCIPAQGGGEIVTATAGLSHS